MSEPIEDPPTAGQMYARIKRARLTRTWWYLVSALALPSDFRDWNLPERRAMWTMIKPDLEQKEKQ